MKLKPIILTASSVIALAVFNTQSFAQSESTEAETPRFERAKEFRKQRSAERRAKKMERVDTNGDGQVDLTEYLTHAEERFNSIDENADGYITTEEQTAAHQLMREEFKQRKQARREQQATDNE